MNTRVVPEFELLMPESIAEAIDMLVQYGDKATVLSGGTDVLVMMKTGFKSDYVISLAKIPGLDNLEYDATEGLRIGAKTTIAQVLSSNDVKTHYPALWDSAYYFATPQLRNTATVVGNLLRASPAGDCSCAVYALGGQLVLQGPQGQRQVDIDDFWLDYCVTAREPDELAVELKIPAPLNGTAHSAFQRLTRTYEDLAKINVAANMDMSGKTCNRARLAMGCVAPTPLRLKKTEALLYGAEITDELLQKVADTVVTEISPIDDIRSTAEYRLQVAGPLLKRVITKACC
jgi:carbon-monoxide dehydrogenase medium subunit